MWFNSKQRAEPYQRLTSRSRLVETPSFSSAGSVTGAAWLSSARVVRCWVKSRNERNPRLQLPSFSWVRSEERRVGKEGVRTCRYRWSPYHKKKKKKEKNRK